MVQMDFEEPKDESPWVSDGLQVVKLKFVRSFEEISSAQEYEPEYVYQHFGDNENIFGYKDLKVTIVYSEATMRHFPIIQYSEEISSEDETMKGDNIMEKLRSQLPADISCQVESVEEFRTILEKEDSFAPFGELIAKFSKGDNNFEVYRVTEERKDFNEYLASVQTLSLWFINACEYTDNSDPKWFHYFLFCTKRRTDGDAGNAYSLAGYATIYSFYAYPQNERPRIAQILLLPPYRRNGTGASFMQRIYSDLCIRKGVVDITVEDPSDNCILLRDYVDCLNCSQLQQFSPELICQGFSSEMVAAAMENYKINKRQCRRVYEILRLRATNKKDEMAMKQYRLLFRIFEIRINDLADSVNTFVDVKRRLEIPMRKTERDWNKLTAALSPQELNQAAASQLSPDEKRKQLQLMYEQQVEAYEKVIDRLLLYPKID